MKTKTVKITLEGFGSYLGMEKGCFIVKNRQGNTDRYPLFENLIDEIKIKSGNFISSGVLASCGFWGIACLFLTQKGRPVAMRARRITAYQSTQVGWIEYPHKHNKAFADARMSPIRKGTGRLGFGVFCHGSVNTTNIQAFSLAIFSIESCSAVVFIFNQEILF